MPNTKIILDKKKEEYTFIDLVKDMWIFLEGKKLVFSFFTLVLVLSNLMPFASAYCLGKIVDFFISYQSNQPLNKFYLLVAAIAFLGVAQTWLRFAAKWRIQQIGAEIRMKARLLAMNKLINLELKWHEKEETGSKIQKISSGGDSLSRSFNLFSNSGISIITGLIGGFTIFLFVNLKYAIFALVYIAIYLYGEYYFNKKIAVIQDEMNKIKEKVSGKIHESASNVLTVKSMGLNKVFAKSAEEYEKQYLEIWMKNKEANQFKTKSIKMFSAAGYALFILIIGLDTVKGAITVGSILIFANYFGRLKGAMEDLTNNLSEFIEVKSGVGRLMTILDRKTIERESSKLLEIPDNWQTIEFKNIGFKYKTKWVFRNFNLKIKRNEKIGLVGRSGCGKSTLVKLLLGLYKIQEGNILIDKNPINEYKQSSIINRIALALQDSEMFNSSLKDNISISTEKVDLILLKEAIEFAEISPLVEKMPKGLDTLIGEKGYKVSGGERQRIGIARALYRNSDILILDEATSNLDSKTESIIQENIEKYLKNKTMLVIAHRLSTLKKVDRIIVIEEGKIIEEGNFESLLKKKGLFYRLHLLQRSKEN